MNHNEILHIWRQHCCLPLFNERPMGFTLKNIMQPPTPTINLSCFNATCIFQDQGMSNYLLFYILEKDDFAMVHPVGIRFVHLAMVCWLPSLPTAPWLASSGACGSYQWSLVSKPVSSASPIGIATDNNHASSRSNNALPPSLETDCRLPASTSVSAILFTMARDYVITSQNGCPAFARAGAGEGFSNGNQDPLSA